jgi:hypothetical protein
VLTDLRQVIIERATVPKRVQTNSDLVLDLSGSLTPLVGLREDSL